MLVLHPRLVGALDAPRRRLQVGAPPGLAQESRAFAACVLPEDWNPAWSQAHRFDRPTGFINVVAGVDEPAVFAVDATRPKSLALFEREDDADVFALLAAAQEAARGGDRQRGV